ncbi:MAG: hypothetical protein GEV07_19855 [Streptosporangiales bacterium]|nr:hypothetical protein [Streptosporangiales bacterium]
MTGLLLGIGGVLAALVGLVLRGGMITSAGAFLSFAIGATAAGLGISARKRARAAIATGFVSVGLAILLAILMVVALLIVTLD